MESYDLDQDSLELLGIFPEELWLLVLNNVDSAALYYQISASSPYFHSLVYPQRTKILFVNVFEIVYNRYGTNHQYPKDYQHILQVRPVCRAWKRGIDLVLQNHFSNYRFLLDQENKYLAKLDYAYNEDGQQFQQHFDRTHLTTNVNPFVRRNISLKCHISNDEFLVQVNLLRKYGHHVWYCMIYISSSFKEEENSYSQLHQLLECLPNLRKLLVYCSGTDYTEVERNQLIAHVKENPLPMLPQLKFLTQVGLPIPVVQALVRSSPRMDMLETENFSFEHNMEICKEEMPSLEQLSISFYNEVEFLDFYVSPVNWQLTKLQLRVEGVSVRWRIIFRLLERKFAGTLKDLNIYMPDTEYLECPATLALPHLEVLTIYVRNFVNLDFLLPMRDNLKELTVKIGDDPTDEELHRMCRFEGVIKFSCFRHRPYKSNVWWVFPNLKEVRSCSFARHCCYVVTRDQWKKYVADRYERRQMRA